MQQIRVAILLPRLSSYGGVERQAYSLAKALAEEGFAVDFLCARQEAPPPSGVQPVQLGRWGATRSGKMFWFAWAAERARRRGGYDVAVGLGKTWRQEVLRISGGPQSAFRHLSIRAYAPGLPRLWKRLRRALALSTWLAGWIERRQLRNARLIITVSHKNRDWLLGAYPWLDPDRVRIVYNRPDPCRFFPVDPGGRDAARLALGAEPGEVAVGAAGTSFMRKNLAACIQAMARLPRSYRLYVAGGRGTERFHRLARGLGVEDRVAFLGRVDDMPGFYHGVDVFVLPSFHDTCSNAVLEALACGTKVVGSADDGSSHFLPEERVVRRPDDPDELARLVQAAAQAPADPPFVWPADVDSGIEPLVRIVREVLKRKTDSSGCSRR